MCALSTNNRCGGAKEDGPVYKMLVSIKLRTHKRQIDRRIPGDLIEQPGQKNLSHGIKRERGEEA